MILKSFKMRLENLKLHNVNISIVLDIGAYRGDFTETINSVYPDAKVFQIEADDRQRKFLNRDAIFSLLGDCNKDSVDFYTLDENKITTGSSIFLELTEHYTDNSTVILKKSMSTLDKLHEIFNFSGDWQNGGFIKIDTQGSELLILSGAKKFLETYEPKFILLECSVQQYNKDAPKINLVMEYMNKLMYDMIDIFDLSYDNSGNLLQTDILFERTKK